MRLAPLIFGSALAVSGAWAALGGAEGGSLLVNAKVGAASFSCPVASITDGDTLRCTDGTRVRLSGIAARERDGSCTEGHPCPPASSGEATAELERLAGGNVLTCRPTGETYGRIAAFCFNSAGVDLSCAMVTNGKAALWPKYWGEHRCD